MKTSKINFAEIKKEMVEKGYFTQEIIDQTLPTIYVKGEFTRDGGFKIKKTQAGFSERNIMGKAFDYDFEIPSERVDEDAFISSLKGMYPECRVKVSLI